MSAGTPVIFDDGSKAFVPPEKLSAAIRDGGKVAQAMQFDDGSKAYVPLDKVHDAIHDGGQLIGAPPQPPRVPMQEQPLNAVQQAGVQVGSDLSRYASEAGASALSAGKNLAHQAYDVSAPNIAEQIYRHVRGLPNTLKDLPPKMVLGFLAAGGLGEAELAESAEGKQVTSVKPAAAPAPEGTATTIPARYSPPEATAASIPEPMNATPSGEAIPRVEPQAAAQGEPVDPLLARLRKIASDIEDQDAAEAAKKAAKKGSTKVPVEPVVPSSDQQLLRLLKQSLVQVQERKSAEGGAVQ